MVARGVGMGTLPPSSCSIIGRRHKAVTCRAISLSQRLRSITTRPGCLCIAIYMCGPWSRNCGICWNSPWQKQISRFHAIGICHSRSHQPARIDKILDWMSLFCHQHRVMPDRSRPGNTRHIDHRRIIIITCPHPHYIIGRIANRPVITKIIRRSCLCRSRSNDSTITVPAILL